MNVRITQDGETKIRTPERLIEVAGKQGVRAEAAFTNLVAVLGFLPRGSVLHIEVPGQPTTTFSLTDEPTND